MSHDETSAQSSRFGMVAVVVLLLVVGLPFLLFLPLGLAIMEDYLFHTHEVEGFFERLGIADELGSIYRPVIEFFYD